MTRLWEYLDRNLEHPEEREISAHLDVCRHCCGEVEFAHRLRERLRQPGEIATLTIDVRGRLEAFLRELGGAR